MTQPVKPQPLVATQPIPPVVNPWLRRVLVINLILEIGIVVTGGLVRLSGSGLDLAAVCSGVVHSGALPGAGVPQAHRVRQPVPDQCREHWRPAGHRRDLALGA